jgi:allantoicase
MAEETERMSSNDGRGSASAAPFKEALDLASERLGGAVIAANDEFFAPKENLVKVQKAVFHEDEFTDRGKWMDGWETRRRRTPGHDWAIVRLGVSGVIRGVVVDTAFFRGNYPEHCSIEACSTRPDAPVDELCSQGMRWVEILPKTPLRGDAQNAFPIASPHRFTHLRLNIFPDGGVARLRVHGEVVADWRRIGHRGSKLDLAAVENGGTVPACSDMFFGVRHHLIMPGRAANMGEGWETRRRRGPGHDWALVALATEALVRRVEVDTNHFKGNYPDTCMIEGIHAAGRGADELLRATDWQELVPRTKLQAHTRHFFEDELVSTGPYTHLRLNIYPDGGVSRLRVVGVATRDGAAMARLRWLNTLTTNEFTEELRAACGSSVWAVRMAAARPFSDVEQLYTTADAVSARLGREDWLEAFRAHPRIGESKPQADSVGPGRDPVGAPSIRPPRSWSSEEQRGMQEADREIVDGLAAGNRAYEEKFGHIFIVCASGKSAAEMLAILRERLPNTPDAELPIAAEEQRKITQIRLKKLLTE